MPGFASLRKAFKTEVSAVGQALDQEGLPVLEILLLDLLELAGLGVGWSRCNRGRACLLVSYGS